MELSFSMLYDDLADLGPETGNSVNWNKTAKLRYPTLFDGKSEVGAFDDRVLYVANAGDLAECKPETFKAHSINVLCIRKPDEDVSADPYLNILWLADCALSKQELLDRLLELFDAYNSWNTEMLEHLAMGGTLQDIVDCTYGMIGFPIALLDSRCQSLAIPPLGGRCSFASATGSEGMPGIRSATDVRTRLGVCGNSTLRRPVFVGTSPESGVSPLLCRKICVRNRVSIYALLIGGADGKPFTDRDYELFDRFCALIEKGNGADAITAASMSTPLVRKVKDLLCNVYSHSLEIDIIYSSLNWERENPIGCITLECRDGRFSDKELMDIAVDIGLSLPDQTLPFVFEHRIVIIASSVGGQGQSYEDIPLYALAVCNEAGLDVAVGVSAQFMGLENLHSYYIQTLKYIGYGIQIDPDSKIFSERNIMTASILCKMFDGNPPIEMFLPTGVKKLIDYDAAHHSQLVPTLFEYLKNERSQIGASASLFIHRNTLTGRMEKIREISELDLDDPDTRFSVMLALSLMQLRGRFFQG